MATTPTLSQSIFDGLKAGGGTFVAPDGYTYFVRDMAAQNMGDANDKPGATGQTEIGRFKTGEAKSSRMIDYFDPSGAFKDTVKDSYQNPLVGLATFAAMAYGLNALGGALSGAASGAVSSGLGLPQAGATGGGAAGAAAGAGGATMSAAEAIALGMTPAEATAMGITITEAGAGALGTGAVSAAAPTAAKLAAGGADVLGSWGPWGVDASQIIPGLGGGSGTTLGLSAKDILAGVTKLAPLALAAGVSKDVPAAQADPALAAAIAGQTGVAQSAEARAAASDAYWRENFAPRLLSQMDQQILLGKELQDFNLGLAKKYDQRYWDTTARFQDQFYDDVNSFNTEDSRRELAGKAMGDVRQGFSAARAIAARDLTRRGVNPGDGKFAGLIGRMATDEALASASAANTTRQQARERGLQLKATAAGLGGNLTSASAGYGGAAGAASQIGMSGVLGAQTGFNANESNYRGALGLASGAYGALGGIGSGLTQLNFQSGRDNAMGWNKLIGMGLGMIPWGK